MKAWLDRDPDPETRDELRRLAEAGDESAIEERFRARLAFGTAGLRGVLGAGPARMNRLVVRETSAGLGAYLLAKVPDARERGVVVGYDGRRNSRVFADDTAAVLTALGLQVHLFDREAPTPLCAFAVTHLGAAAGVMVTASHNPPEYNGYKVYWQNGAQIIPPHDSGIAAEIDQAARRELAYLELAEGRRRGLVRTLGTEVSDAYLRGVARLSVHAGVSARQSLSIAYTPLHGVGARLAEAALGQAGFRNVKTVTAQREPDGRFPTVRFPNPEEPGAMDAVVALARESGADLACANDPDADRLAVAARTEGGEYRMLSGDQIGALLGADLLRHAPPRAVVATTIVSSRLLGVMARARGAGYIETLTGFKWIANEAMAHEAKGEQFVFGYEEALGYTVGALVRDKDGISALVAFAELATECKARGQTVFDRLEAIYREHGLYLSAQRSIALVPERHGPGVGELLRARRPQSVAGRDVAATVDLLRGERTSADGRTEPVSLPASDVLVFYLAGDARVVVRPSGTEPKLKCYYEVHEAVSANEPFARAEARARDGLESLIAAHQREIAALST